MHARTDVSRDISYAHSSPSRGGRTVIRLMENATGRLRLIRRARGYQDDIAAGADFWSVMVARFGLSLQIAGGSLDRVPRDGPLLVIANHPYGILDGLMLGYILSRRRDEFRILAHQVFRKAPDIARHILPVSFDEDREALRLNLETRAEALAHLRQGGAVGVFPGGTVSTAARPFGQPMDPGWRGFTARMVAKSDAVVVPVFFDGHTSRLFQIASHLHSTLRMGLLIQEFRRRMDQPVRVVVGDPIGRDVLDPLARDGHALMDHLRRATYALSPCPPKPGELGHEFETRYRRAG